MIKINIFDFQENAIKLIGKDSMLVTAGNEQACNTMTASWGGLGELWNKPVAFVFIRPQRYTIEFVEREEYFTLSFFTPEYRHALNVCGVKSGRDGDKITEAGLHTAFTELGTPYLQEARLVLECKKLYGQFLDGDAFLYPEDKKHYPKGDYHKMYIGQIVNTWIKE